MTKYKVVVPDAITWEFDEIVAGGQNDRYAMTITLAPYGTLINDPKLSKTAGKWGWSVAPGAHGRSDSRVSVGGWTFGVPTASKHKDWAFEFIQFSCSKEWMKALRGARQCAAAGVGAERSRGDGELRLGAGAGRGDADRHTGAARADLADHGTGLRTGFRRC